MIPCNSSNNVLSHNTTQISQETNQPSQPSFSVEGIPNASAIKANESHAQKGNVPTVTRTSPPPQEYGNNNAFLSSSTAGVARKATVSDPTKRPPHYRLHRTFSEPDLFSPQYQVANRKSKHHHGNIQQSNLNASKEKPRPPTPIPVKQEDD